MTPTTPQDLLAPLKDCADLPPLSGTAVIAHVHRQDRRRRSAVTAAVVVVVAASAVLAVHRPPGLAPAQAPRYVPPTAAPHPVVLRHPVWEQRAVHGIRMERDPRRLRLQYAGGASWPCEGTARATVAESAASVRVTVEVQRTRDEAHDPGSHACTENDENLGVTLEAPVGTRTVVTVEQGRQVPVPVVGASYDLSPTALPPGYELASEGAPSGTRGWWRRWSDALHPPRAMMPVDAATRPDVTVYIDAPHPWDQAHVAVVGAVRVRGQQAKVLRDTINGGLFVTWQDLATDHHLTVWSVPQVPGARAYTARQLERIASSIAPTP
ncbi:hypothetical protein EV189_3732 [Motilibacter rhizosphaerae]|uniref:Uncharacterized protein n=1 Tax=Motilibacter rhizosphaerae TaxID=598652 RepID=A0A4Q7NA58_9ACTN|nr:hypothetical protein [Motilibacter rhizosphaerae]RZS79380.1 hypothetical protein EV189_3732 [Motilibacter rhizosphaerae]